MENKQTYLAYSVQDGKDSDRSFWTKIGVAFDHKDGEGINIVLDCMPLNGRVVLRKPKKEENDT